MLLYGHNIVMSVIELQALAMLSVRICLCSTGVVLRVIEIQALVLCTVISFVHVTGECL